VAARISGYEERLRGLTARDQYHLLEPITGPTNHRVTVRGRELIMLGSYSYLGLIGHPRIDAAATAAVAEWGTGAGGVRLLTGNTGLHERLEARLARFAGREDAVLYASGYVTNVAILSALAGPGDLVLMDMLDHASIVDGALLSGARWKTWRHGDMGHLERQLREAQGKYGTILVVADSTFSMDGDVLDLPRAAALCREHGARLVVDEAHSIGALGDDGKAFDLARELFDRGLFVCPIGHPAVPKGQARLRLTVMATHTDGELDFALAAIEEAGRALGLLQREAVGA